MSVAPHIDRPALALNALVLLAALVSTRCASAPPSETPVPTASGIRLYDISGAIGSPSIRGYGVSLVDYDDDGNADVTLAHEGGLIVMRGNGKLGFTLDNDRSGLPAALPGAHGVVWVDADGDGDLDLFVTRRTLLRLPKTSGDFGCRLFENTGGARFVDRTAEAGLGKPGAWEGAAFGDLDGDDDLDLVLAGGTVAQTAGANRAPGHRGSPNYVFENKGDLHFEDASATVGCTGPADSESWGVMVFDLDLDGRQDFIIGNDRTASSYCHNEGDGKLTASKAIESMSAGGVMGWAVGDLGGDGCPDVFGTIFGAMSVQVLTAAGTLPNAYVDLLGDGFDPAAAVSGWGASFSDLDLDGDQDVFWVGAIDIHFGNGNGQLLPGAMAVLENRPGINTAAPALGGLVDVSAEVGDRFFEDQNAYGLAQADLDHDGDEDFLIGVDNVIPPEVMPGSGPFTTNTMLLLNLSDTAGKHALSLTLEQPGKNPRAVGATVIVSVGGKRTMGVVTAGASYLSSLDYTLHFGLGTAARPEWVAVRWPDGTVEVHTDVAGGDVRLGRSGLPCTPAGTCDGIVPSQCVAYEGPPEWCRPAANPTTRCNEMCDLLDRCHKLSLLFAKDKAECVAHCELCPADEASAQTILDLGCVL